MRPSEKFVLAAIVLVCVALRLWPLRFDYFHPDEVIAVEVAHHVVESGSLDTNWKNAALPVDFKLPQYNFSGYLLSAAGVEALRTLLPPDARPSTLWSLRLWSALLALGVSALSFVVGRRLFGVSTGLAATVLVAFNPLLVQDAFYARPEPFVTALTLLMILSGSSARTRSPRIFAAAVIAGVLVATKISMLALVPLLFAPATSAQARGRFAADLWAYVRAALAQFPARAVIAAVGLSLGFILAAPFALVHGGDYLEGVRFLIRQYNIPQWPYGLGEASVADRLRYVMSYFTATTGGLTLVFSMAGAAWAARVRNFHAASIFLCVAGFAVWFAAYPTFFERNFSHLMPVILIFAAHAIVTLAGYLQNVKGRAAAFTVCLGAALFPAAKTTYFLLHEEITGKSWREVGVLRAALSHRYGVELTILGSDRDYNHLRDENFRFCRRWLVEVPHYHGTRSDTALERVQTMTDFKEVGRFTSHFAYIPTSSLHTYLMPTRVYFLREDKTGGCEHGPDVDPRDAGARIDPVAMEVQSAWTAGGTYPSTAEFTPDGYFTSWSWTRDDNAGALTLTLAVEGQSEIILPYLTGPNTEHQSLRISDNDTGAEILNLSPLPAASHWRYLRVPLPPETHHILVEDLDGGATGAEWQAVGMPRQSRLAAR